MSLLNACQTSKIDTLEKIPLLNLNFKTSKNVMQTVCAFPYLLSGWGKVSFKLLNVN